MAKKRNTAKKATAKKIVRKALDLQDLKRAEMDPKLQYRMKQKNTMPMILTAQDQVLVRKFARMTWQVAKQRNSDMTVDKLRNNLIAVLRKTRPELRKVMLEQMREYVSADK